MTKRPTINTLTNTASPTYLTQLNQNFTNVKTQFDNTLSLDGSLPNAMNADFDLNGNDLINGGTLSADDIVIGGTSIGTQVSNAAASATSAATSASSASASATTATAYTPAYFNNFTALKADTRSWPVGQLLNTRAEGFAYQVAASGATDHHVTTTGGTKLYVQKETIGYNVKAFGAVGDGSVDDATVIQTAINSMSASGGTLFFPKGSYKTDSGIVLVSNLTMQGEAGATLKPSSSVPFWAYRGVSTSNVKVKDLTFEGTGVAFSSGNQRLLQIESGSKIEISASTFTKSREGGLSINACSDVIVANCNFNQNYGTGLTTRDDCSRVTVDSCIFYLNGNTGVASSSGGRGIVFWRTANSVVSNCIFEANTEYGLRLYSEAADADANRNIAVSNCAFRDNGTTSSGKIDLYIYNEQGSTERVDVTGCTFSTRTGNTSAVMSGTNMTLSGCSFKAITPRSTNTAVSLFGSTNVTCTGNAITDFVSAFSMSATAGAVTTKCTIANNQIEGVTAFSSASIVGTGNAIIGNSIKKGGSGTTDVCFSITTSSTSCKISGNIIDGFYRGIYSASTGALIEVKNNTTINSTGSGFSAEFQTDLSNYIVDGNSFDSAYPNIFGQISKPSLASFGRAVFSANTIPSAGGTGGGQSVTWARGDRATNNAPAAGSPKAWVCTVAGTPGTWVSEGNL